MDMQAIYHWLEQITWWEHTFWNNSVARWTWALGLAAAVFLTQKILIRIIASRFKRITEATESQWDEGILETLKSTRNWFLLLVSIYVGSLVLQLPDRVRTVVQTVVILALLLQAALWGSQLLNVFISDYLRKRRESDPGVATTVSAVKLISKLALWSIILLLALDNLGIDVTALVAGLGVGGIAVALAAQNILGDLFASLSIVFDKPFVLGDFIIVGDQVGTVEKVGLKTTRLRALSGEQLVIANTDLLQSRIQNLKRMSERRVVFHVGVVYETSPSILKSLPQTIREIVEAQENVRFDRSHFKSFDDSALTFETVYYVLVPDYDVYMDVQQAINLALFDKFAADDIAFAYPTQTLYVQGADSLPTEPSVAT